MHGFTKPHGISKRRVSGEERFLQAWRAYEAEQQVLARRADAKLDFQHGRRIPTLSDTTCQRQWFLADAEQDTVVQEWLLPWLRGKGRRCYTGPWLTGGPPSYRPVKDSTGKLLPNCRPRYKEQHFNAWHNKAHLGFLPPLPQNVANEVLRFVGHIRVEREDEGVDVLLISNTTDGVALARAAAGHMGHDCDDAILTSIGVHDEQLTPEEYFAYVMVDPNANLD